MKVNSLELVDLASIKVGNDAELARRLGHGRAYVSLLRSGKRPLTGELAVRLADLAGVPREVAVIAAAEARAETDAERETWARLRELVTAACLLLVVLGGGVPATAMAGTHATTGVSGIPRGIYIMRRAAQQKRRLGMLNWWSAFRAELGRWQIPTRRRSRA